MDSLVFVPYVLRRLFALAQDRSSSSSIRLAYHYRSMNCRML